MITSHETADEVLNMLRLHPLGKDAALIGRITTKHKGLRLRTKIGGERVLDMLEDDMLPRIC